MPPTELFVGGKASSVDKLGHLTCRQACPHCITASREYGLVGEIV